MCEASFGHAEIGVAAGGVPKANDRERVGYVVQLNYDSVRPDDGFAQSFARILRHDTGAAGMLSQAFDGRNQTFADFTGSQGVIGCEI